MSTPVVSLFSGCGGLDLGFAHEEFDTVLALDINAAAVETYNHNRRKTVARVANLAEVDGDAIIRMIEEQGIESPKGIIGGAPCQTFSKGNVHVKSNDIRHTLPEKFAAILKTLNGLYDLDFFVFENVKGITFKKHKETFVGFKELFEDAGFVLYEGLLDAHDFDVPQKRPRVFVVGFNKSRYSKTSIFHFPPPLWNTNRTVASAIDGLPTPVFFSRSLTPENIAYHPNHWTMRPKSKKFDNGYLQEGQSKGRSFRVLSWSSPSWTVAYGHREIHIHPTGTRRLSVYEAMRLQGFPETYQLRGNFGEQVTQVSDAVPPPLAMFLARSIRQFLSDNQAAPTVHVQLSLIPDESRRGQFSDTFDEIERCATVAG